MSKFINAFLVIFFCISVLNGPQANATSQVFNQQQFKSIKAKHAGKKWLMLLWSVDCPPCFKELAMIEKLMNETSELAVVIVNADDDDEVSSERVAIINQFNLTQLENFHFADGLADQSRFLIDSSWYGELPRSYFIEENGKFHGKSGLVTMTLLQDWLIN